MMPRWRKSLLGLALVPILTNVPAVHAEITAADVRQAIARGVSYLQSEQDAQKGNWDEQLGYPGGVTALCTLALLNCGVPPDDPVIQRALDYLRRPQKPLRTYSVSLQTMVLCAAAPERDRIQIRDNVLWLQKIQVADGPLSGAWSYDETQGAGDHSNTQFAMLALHEAERIGVEVQDIVWRRALGYWTRQQRADGSWGYNPELPSTGSMACAGIASTLIAVGQSGDGDARVNDDGSVDCCVPQTANPVATKGLEWLARNFSVTSNPYAGTTRNRSYSQTWFLYYIYGIERVGRLSGQRFIGEHDWYREGADSLLDRQDSITGSWKGVGVEANPHIATPLALLFLAKGRRPVVAAKLNHDSVGGDWNHHRNDLGNLTRDVERRWQRDLTWQTIQQDRAELDDLLESPVLYVSGRDELKFSDEDKRRLRQYVEQGGFIFADACCNGSGFDTSFRQLMVELFPDSPMQLLPPDHPVWYAEARVPAELMRPLYGVDSCCRTAVVYCPDDLSCYWELGDVRRLKSLPQPVADEVRAALTMGANVITYATNRQLKEKLDLPEVLQPSDHSVVDQRGTLYVAKLRHRGGSDDAPAALTNLLRVAREQLQSRVSDRKTMLLPTDANLPDYPIAFLHGRRSFQFTAAERSALAQYLGNGGFLFADSICASRSFTESFRREMQLIFPEGSWITLPADHPIFSTQYQGSDISKVRLRDPQLRPAPDQPIDSRVEQVAPVLEALELDGRLLVVFSPYDLSCALENQASIQCKGYLREDAAKIGINILLYAMQQ